MNASDLKNLLEDQLKDLYSAETQLVKALPKMAKAATTSGLQSAITAHLDETRGQVNRLDRIGKELDITLTGKKCAAMEGLIAEGGEAIDMDGPDDVIDLAII